MAGIDIGTSFLIAAREGEGDTVSYREHRDAFFRITPATPIAAKMIESGLKGKKYFKDNNGDLVVIGQDAIDKAVERNTSARRPLHRGVISPTEKEALPVLKFIIKELLGDPQSPQESIAFSVPAQPIDQPADQFDTGYHEDVIGNFLKELGYKPLALNEAEAVGYSELMDDGLTGVTLSCGAGMINVCVMSSGEPILKFSVTKSGDYVDRMVAVATHQPDTVIQMEKEAGGYSIANNNQDNEIHKALAIYYRRLINYVVESLSSRLSNSADLPKFQQPIPVVISGGTSLAEGFADVFREELKSVSLPFQVSEVRLAKDQLRSVARGLLLASELL